MSLSEVKILRKKRDALLEKVWLQTNSETQRLYDLREAFETQKKIVDLLQREHGEPA